MQFNWLAAPHVYKVVVDFSGLDPELPRNGTTTDVTGMHTALGSPNFNPASNPNSNHPARRRWR